MEFWVTTGVLCLTLLIYYRQWRAMEQQIELARSGTRTQNLLAIVGFLWAEAARLDRWWVMNKLADKKVDEWESDDRVHASRACSAFDLVGIMTKEQMIPGDILIQSWAPSICRTYEATAAFRGLMKERNGASYWGHFDWLYGEATKGWRGES